MTTIEYLDIEIARLIARKRYCEQRPYNDRLHEQALQLEAELEELRNLRMNATTSENDE